MSDSPIQSMFVETNVSNGSIHPSIDINSIQLNQSNNQSTNQSNNQSVNQSADMNIPIDVWTVVFPFLTFKSITGHFGRSNHQISELAIQSIRRRLNQSFELPFDSTNNSLTDKWRSTNQSVNRSLCINCPMLERAKSLGEANASYQLALDDPFSSTWSGYNGDRPIEGKQPIDAITHCETCVELSISDLTWINRELDFWLFQPLHSHEWLVRVHAAMTRYKFCLSRAALQPYIQPGDWIPLQVVFLVLFYTYGSAQTYERIARVWEYQQKLIDRSRFVSRPLTTPIPVKQQNENYDLKRGCCLCEFIVDILTTIGQICVSFGQGCDDFDGFDD